MRVCSKCSKSKPDSEFYPTNKNKDGIESSCKDCGARKARHGRLSLRKRVEERLRLGNKRCADCGELDPAVLDFCPVDDGSGKKVSVKYLVNHRKAWAIIEEAMKDCNVCCANCQKRRETKALAA